MSLNILLILMVIILIFYVKEGYRKGMVKSVISFVSLVALCIVATLLANALDSYMDGEIVKVIVMLLLLCLVGIARHALGIVFFSAKILSKLPVVSWLDKLLGIVVGVLETIVLLWTLYAFVMLMDLGMIGQMILDYTEESAILTRLYEGNYLMYLLEQIGSNIHI